MIQSAAASSRQNGLANPCQNFIQRRGGSHPRNARSVTPLQHLTPGRLECLLHIQYFDMVQTWGNWPEFQALLEILSSVAEKHGEGISITNVASRWVLQQPAVGAIIVGNRLGVSSHAVENLNIFRFELDEDDVAAIDKVALGEGGHKTKAVFEKLGDCGSEYRAMH